MEQTKSRAAIHADAAPTGKTTYTGDKGQGSERLLSYVYTAVLASVLNDFVVDPQLAAMNICVPQRKINKYVH